MLLNHLFVPSFPVIVMLICPLIVAAQETGQGEPAEVVVVSTHHFITNLPEDYSPGHLRALLKKIDPDVVAVEAPENVDDPVSQAPLEISRVVVPWAEANDVAVVPVGWNEAGYPLQVNRMLEELYASGKAGEYQRIELRFQKNRSALSAGCENLNSDGHHQVWRDYHRELSELSGKETPWQAWNGKILENVVKTCNENPGKRIAVVIGGAHSYFLLDGLASEPSAKVIRTDQFLPLSQNEIESAARPLDYLQALHPLNLDVLPAAELQRLKPLLDQLQGVGNLRGDYQLFLGKYLLHTKKPKEALTAFEVLGQFPRDAKSKFDERVRLFETGLVYSALAYYQMGDRDTAVQRLQNAIRDQDLQDETREWARQVLRLVDQ